MAEYRWATQIAFARVPKSFSLVCVMVGGAGVAARGDSIPRFDNTFDMFANPYYSEAALYMYNMGKAAETLPISCPAIENPWPQEIFVSISNTNE